MRFSVTAALVTMGTTGSALTTFLGETFTDSKCRYMNANTWYDYPGRCETIGTTSDGAVMLRTGANANSVLLGYGQYDCGGDPIFNVTGANICTPFNGLDILSWAGWIDGVDA